MLSIRPQLQRSLSLHACRFVSALCVAVASPPPADPRGLQPDAAFTQFGAGDATQSWAGGLQWDWNREWRISRSLIVRGRWEICAGRWRTELSERETAWAWITQLSAAPDLRLSQASRIGW
jgi:hypothetical protein